MLRKWEWESSDYSENSQQKISVSLHLWSNTKRNIIIRSKKRSIVTSMSCVIYNIISGFKKGEDQQLKNASNLFKIQKWMRKRKKDHVHKDSLHLKRPLLIKLKPHLPLKIMKKYCISRQAKSNLTKMTYSTTHLFLSILY